MKQVVRVIQADISYSHNTRVAVIQSVFQQHVSKLNSEGLKVVSFHFPDNSSGTQFVIYICEQI